MVINVIFCDSIKRSGRVVQGGENLNFLTRPLNFNTPPQQLKFEPKEAQKVSLYLLKGV
jgi:hypothetical protein